MPAAVESRENFLERWVQGAAQKWCPFSHSGLPIQMKIGLDIGDVFAKSFNFR